LILIVGSLFGGDLRDKISNMLIVGFEGTSLPKDLKNFISKHPLGGVVLFSKNITSPSQLKRLTKEIKENSLTKILIATDQEGGVVSRLNGKNGFIDFPKPSSIKDLPIKKVKEIYDQMGKILKEEGINLNFAPVVDLSINPKNRIIYRYGRSFGKSSKEVMKYASIFIEQMRKNGITTSLKHFPGHGSSLSDTHEGFTDVTKLWRKEELIPFFKLNSKTIMIAHIFNALLDPKYPASLSKKTINLLREKGVDKVLISDDLQMGAITKNYDLNTTLKLSINAGVDMLLFANQTSHPLSAIFLTNLIYDLVQKGDIEYTRIFEANKRVEDLKRRIYW
jgi:beta-N-acetylhexosaminidase